jgi:hypothetical protein
MPKDTVVGCGGSACFPGSHEFAATQDVKGRLDCAFGKAGGFSDVPKAAGHWTPMAARCQSIDVQINDECCRMFVMADEVTH